MIVIDPKGLFEGERLAACSDAAQLHWQRLFLGSNGFGRLELSYSVIASNIYKNFRNPPKEDELWGFFEGFAENYLVVLYQVDGIWWAQWDTSTKYLPRYQTVHDKQSPSPPLDLLERHRGGYREWKRSKSVRNQRFQKFAENSENIPKVSDAVAVAVTNAEDISLPTEAHPKAALVGNGFEHSCTELIHRTFALYCESLGRNSNQYTLTEKRRKSAMSRLKERLAVHEGDLLAVEEEFGRAVGNLASSDWHRENGHIDWTDQIFKDAETFEKRLNWQRPIGGSNGTTSNYSKAKSSGTANAFYRSVEEDSDQDNAWQPSSDAASGDRGTGLQGLQRTPPTYELPDIKQVLEKIGLTEREEGETSFPPLAKVINRITSLVNARKRAERELKENLEQEEKERLYEEDLRLNPEKYAARDREIDEKIAALSAKFDIARKSAPPPTPAPVMTDCPHCQKQLPLASGISFMTSTS